MPPNLKKSVQDAFLANTELPPDNRDLTNDSPPPLPPPRRVWTNRVGGVVGGRKKYMRRSRWLFVGGKTGGELGMNCGFMYGMVELDRVMYSSTVNLIDAGTV